MEIYQSLPQAQIGFSQFLIPQSFEVFDIFSRRAFGRQVVQSSHIWQSKKLLNQLEGKTINPASLNKHTSKR